MLILNLYIYCSICESDDNINIINDYIRDKKYSHCYELSSSQIRKEGFIDANPLLYHLRGVCSFHMEKYADSVGDFTKFLSRTSKSNHIKDAHRYRCEANLELGNLDDTKIDLPDITDKKLKDKVKFVSYLSHLANQRLIEGDHKEALNKYRKILESCSKSSEFILKAMESALNLSNIELFDSLALNMSRIDPKNTQYCLLSGKKRFSENKIGLAINQFKLCSGKSNECVRLLRVAKQYENLFKNATKLVRNKNYKEAKPIIDELTELVDKWASDTSPIRAEVDLLDVKILISQGKQQQALNMLNKLISSKVKSSVLYIQRADLLLSLGDFEGAIADYKAVLENDKNNVQAKNGLRRASEAREKDKNFDYYEIIGVKRGCSQKELKDAFRKAVMKWHPDRYPDPIKKREAERTMKKINKAMEVLSDPQKRRMYDQGIDPDAPQPDPGQEHQRQQNQQHSQQYHRGGNIFNGGFPFHENMFGGNIDPNIFRRFIKM